VVNAVRFPTSDGLTLQGELRRPDSGPRGTAVLCHPLPTHGGSKDHPLLWALRNDLATRRGLVVLGFNFRGVMGSEGSFGGGDAELSDVSAAVDRVRQEADGPTFVAGWSFGAMMALRHAAADDRVAALALLGLPLGHAAGSVAPGLDGPIPERLEIPVLLVAGDRDRFCPLPTCRAFRRRLPRAELLVVTDAGHFFRRREREVAEGVGRFVDRVLDQRRS
jgi:alpha/beta superfamily hydrolase